MLPETSENLPDHLAVPGEIRMRDENVVEVYHDVTRHDEILKDIIHHSLEGRGGVGQAEVHHQGFEESPVRPEGGLPLVALSDADVVKAPAYVEFRKEPGTLQSVNKVVDQGEWVPVLHGHRIERPVVLHEPEGPVLLLDKEDRGSHGRLRGADPAGSQALLDERVELVLLEGRDRVDLAVGWLRVWDELDGVIPRP